MNLRSLHGPAEPAGATRWVGSAAAIALLHTGLMLAALAWYQQSPLAGTAIPVILIDMAPATAAPEPQPEDIAPGPEMQQSEMAAESEPEPPPKVEPQPQAPPLPSTPPQDKPAAELPPEQIATPEPPPKPEPARIVPDPPRPQAKPKPQPEPELKRETKPDRRNSKPVREAKQSSDRPPAPRSSAPPRAERRAAAAGAARAGAAAAAALPSYRDRLAAHLQRFKQYPSGSKAAGEQGTAVLSFTVGRGGQLLGSRLARSSGSAALDAETMAMVRRAQPLPSFPPEMTQAALSFTVPVRFSLR